MSNMHVSHFDYLNRYHTMLLRVMFMQMATPPRSTHTLHASEQCKQRRRRLLAQRIPSIRRRRWEQRTFHISCRADQVTRSFLPQIIPDSSFANRCVWFCWEAGCYFFVGARLPGEVRPHHKAVFDFDEVRALI
jgi:hypothetical protein